MSGSGRWSDLAARLVSAVVLAAIGIGAVLAGGHVFHLFLALASGVMVWELMRMLSPTDPRNAVALGAISAVALVLAVHAAPGLSLPVLLIPALAGGFVSVRYRGVGFLYTAMIVLAGYEMALLRDLSGPVWLLWLILIVIASDVSGYFAGKMIGGPKFWPRISPKKTWSGTVAGWIGAALVGLVFALSQQTGLALVAFSVLVGFAAQMGDIAESAIKRKTGVKDSSALIPGHGGLLDRFDGMLGAALFVLLLSVTIGLSFGAV